MTRIPLIRWNHIWFIPALLCLISVSAFGQAIDIHVASPVSKMVATFQDQEEDLNDTATDEDPDEQVPASEAAESLQPLQNREIGTKVSAVNLSMAGLGTGALPEPAEYEKFNVKMELPDGVVRGATYKCVHWRASLIQTNPLYFEEAMLERHGHDRWGYLQPFASGIRFYGTIALYPYIRTLQPPCECRYVLGHYRPGTCAPILKDHLPYDKRAAAVETLALASFFWAAPL